MSEAIRNEAPAEAGASCSLRNVVEAEEPRGELAWFRYQLGRALWRPRTFAQAVAREHFGIASVLVALIAGFALSLSIDSLVLASKGFEPQGFVTRLLIDAAGLALRLTVTAAVVSAITFGGLWLIGRRRTHASLEQVFTALAFALIPLALLPPLAFVLGLAPETLPVVGVLLALVFVRVLAGIALNLRSLLPLPLAAVALALAVGSGWYALQDQVARVRAVTYAYAPGLAPELAATAPDAPRYEGDSWSIVMPARWTNATRGVRGEAARFETDRDVLVISRVRGDPLLTAEEYADRVASEQRRGFSDTRTTRAVWRNAGRILIDERTHATYEGKRMILRQFTSVNGTQVMALVFRFIEPQDEAALMAEAESIAAGWRIGLER